MQRLSSCRIAKLKLYVLIFVWYNVHYAASQLQRVQCIHLDFMELKQMLEKIGQPKTHLECKKMIKEVNKRDSDTINYREFLDMMLGSKNSVLRL